METELRSLYLNLLKRCLAGMIYEDRPAFIFVAPGVVDRSPQKFVRAYRQAGRDIPTEAHTAIGLRRLDNLQNCIEQVLADNIPGDLVETGVWRGGATILMRGVLAAFGVRDRAVWAADSFAGLPEPDPVRFPADKMWQSNAHQLAVSLETVRGNFARYDLLDDQVRFLPGWFKDTLPTAPIERLAVLRLDGDLYQSTMEALTHLYPRLSVGGFVIADDYNVKSCRQAVHDFRHAHGITDPIIDIDGFGVYWRRQA